MITSDIIGRTEQYPMDPLQSRVIETYPKWIWHILKYYIDKCHVPADQTLFTRAVQSLCPLSIIYSTWSQSHLQAMYERWQDSQCVCGVITPAHCKQTSALTRVRRRWTNKLIFFRCVILFHLWFGCQAQWIIITIIMSELCISISFGSHASMWCMVYCRNYNLETS